MSKERKILILGILTALLPISGFPTNWKKFLLFIVGILISYMAWQILRENKNNKKPQKFKQGIFVENRNILEKKMNKIETSSTQTTEMPTENNF